jgi:hypothetical protein
MATVPCPGCGHQAADDAKACSQCGRALNQTNGVPDRRLPPDLLAWARQTFDEEEFMAGVREIRETGGLRFEDFIGEIEQRVRAGE